MRLKVLSSSLNFAQPTKDAFLGNCLSTKICNLYLIVYVNRIVNITECDRNLSLETKQETQDDIAVEFQMSYASQFNRDWIERQVAIAEDLDTFSEYPLDWQAYKILLLGAKRLE